MRYFIVSYTAANKKGGHDIGVCSLSTSGSFVNRNKTNEGILSSNDDLSVVVITNIIEVSESDYKDWNK